MSKSSENRPALIQRFTLNHSQFTDHIVQKNNLDRHGFKDWVFCPGMLFNSEMQWWNEKGKRDRHHEGLDLLLYRGTNGEIFSLDEKTEVPAIYDGTIVRVIDDFLGRSIFMEHHSQGNSKLITAFGHTEPLAGIEVGSRVKEGDIIATIAAVRDPKVKIAPHLHITAVWTSMDLSYKMLDWETIRDSEMIRLADPLDMIGGGLLLESSSPGCQQL